MLPPSDGYESGSSVSDWGLSMNRSENSENHDPFEEESEHIENFSMEEWISFTTLNAPRKEFGKSTGVKVQQTFLLKSSLSSINGESNASSTSKGIPDRTDLTSSPIGDKTRN